MFLIFETAFDKSKLKPQDLCLLFQQDISESCP